MSLTTTSYPPATWEPYEQLAYRRISTPGGRMLVVALDHPMSWMVDEVITDQQWREMKYDIVRYLGNHSPSILLDVGVALPGVVSEGVLSKDTALVIGMDDPVWVDDPDTGLRESRVIQGYSPETARRSGATAVKMLVWYRPDREDEDGHAVTLMRRLVRECQANGLPFILELMTYPLEGESPEEFAALQPELIVRAAETGRAVGAPILKLQYPGSETGCRAVTEAAGDVPWALLSAAVGHEEFLVQMANALRGGARGAMVGRSLWKDCVSLDSEERARLLTERALPRLAELAALLERE